MLSCGKIQSCETTVPAVTIIGAAIIDVLAGPVNEQVFQTGSQAMEMSRLTFGGDALNEAVALTKLGISTGLISKVGKDEAGDRVLDYLEENGLSTECVKREENLQTGINIVLIDDEGERHFLTNPNGSLRKLEMKDITPHLSEAADIVSFASIFVSPLLDIPAMTELFRKIKGKPGRILVADLTKAKKGEQLKDLKELLPYIDYILPNHEEIALLTGSRDATKNAQLLVKEGAGCAVVKCGAEGCVVCTKEACYHIRAYPVQKVKDTTGAGDCFAAGFLWGLTQKWSPEECARLACATASCAVEQVGATEGIVSTEEIMRRYKELGIMEMSI